jgi:hypothetical protein
MMRRMRDQGRRARSEPAICTPEYEYRIGQGTPTCRARAIGRRSCRSVGGLTVSQFLIEGKGVWAELRDAVAELDQPPAGRHSG